MILYRVDECAIFCKTKDEFGGLSNMCSGYTIRMGDETVLTSEHLYQAFRFTAHPEIQRQLLAIKSPMAAKMFAKKNKEFSRTDWEDIKIAIMTWCLDLKLLNNPETFKSLLFSTGDRDIVELSKKDDFWGAKPFNGVFLRGTNVLGRLLWIQRRRLEAGLDPYREPPRQISDLLFLGSDAIEMVAQ